MGMECYVKQYGVETSQGRISVPIYLVIHFIRIHTKSLLLQEGSIYWGSGKKHLPKLSGSPPNACQLQSDGIQKILSC